tara:strand:+ start:3686 stop:3850 length:165 start_codon:yes stop_codon:yes gene_type:complete
MKGMKGGWQFVLSVESGEAPAFSICLVYQNTAISAENVVVLFIKSADYYLKHVH